MAKLLRSRDRILLGLAVLGDLLDEVVGGGSRAYHARKLGFYTPPWYPKNALQASVSRMLKTGLISKKIKKGEVVWELTGSGKNQLVRSFPLLKWQQSGWDGWWRIVIFDVTEKQRKVRDSLRSKLVELGFGQWQKSAYVSPHDVAQDMLEFLEAAHLSGQASVFTAKELGPGQTEKIEKMWKLDKLNNRYSYIVEEWGKIKDKNLNQKEARKIISQYLSTIETDPFLPRELLPKPWFGIKAKEVFNQLRKQLKYLDSF
ncbi:MAG: repressor [Candidatus Beckwithbacteria bacterium GW2011_GWA2_43_10]|uniref:Repressor n=1 Tax=Candidatus Beckwithbacteria bacterium GW2011_GWA2_43_10 TaxID=1618369 RepID=A0A0G1ECA7_9BACT|nr:MAG: repressor [Candidatus Beckwithbacteria bacterium GW2011_GWA2_43_10]